MLPFVCTTSPTNQSSVVQALASVLSIQIPKLLNTGLCLVPGLTTLSKQGLDLAAPVLIGCMMLFLISCWRVGKAWLISCRHGNGIARSRRPGGPASPSSPGNKITKSTLSSVRVARNGEASEVSPLLPVIQSFDSSRRDGVQFDGRYPEVIIRADSEEFSVDAMSASLRARLFGAAVNFLLSAYAAVTLAITQLLHCTSVPATAPSSSWLFIDGTIRCNLLTWQFPFVVVLLVLATLPLAVWWTARWVSKPPSRASAANVAVPSESSSILWADFRWGVHRALCGSYQPERPWWEAVLMLQRFLLSVAYTFLSSQAPGVAQLVCSVMCVAFLVLHLSQPAFRNSVTQTLQTALLVCLTIASISSGPLANAYETASLAQTTRAEDVADVLRLLCSYVAPPLCVVAAYVAPTIHAAGLAHGKW